MSAIAPQTDPSSSLRQLCPVSLKQFGTGGLALWSAWSILANERRDVIQFFARIATSIGRWETLTPVRCRTFSQIADRDADAGLRRSNDASARHLLTIVTP